MIKGEIMEQPECASCGVTEINLVWAIWARWGRAAGHIRCAGCLPRFPAWMRGRI